MEMVKNMLLKVIGKIIKGLEGKPDTTFIISDDDFMSLASGKANAQNLVMTV